MKELINEDFFIEDFKNWSDKIDRFVEDSNGDEWVNNRAASPQWTNELWMAKLAEVGVAQYLHKKGYPLVEPDFNIYMKSQKNWDPDLIYNHLGYPDIHVKSCSQKTQKILASINEEYSWTFNWQSEKGGGRDKIFKEGGKVALTYVGDVGYNWVRIIGFADFFKDIRDNLKPPIAHRLKPYKKCFYFKDFL